MEKDTPHFLIKYNPMTENRKYEIPKTPEDRIVDALESIADSLKTISEHIVSDPGDEVDPIVKRYNIPDDINNIP
jgi:hypothetical protein